MAAPVRSLAVCPLQKIYLSYEAGRRLEIVEYVNVAQALKADPQEGLGVVMGDRSLG
jgi:hypothetical protein